MKDLSLWVEQLKKQAGPWLDRFLDFLPDLLGSLVIVLIGILVARLLKTLLMGSARGMNRLLERVFRGGLLARFRLSPAFIRLFSKIVYWLTVLFFVSLATQQLGMTAFSQWLNRVATYAPTLFAGGLVILVGILLSTLARDLTASALESAHIQKSRLLASFAQGTVLVTAIVIGLDQMAVDITFLMILVSILLAAVMGGFVVAVAIGARDLVSNLIGSHNQQKRYPPGQKIRIGAIEGMVLEWTSTSVILSTEEGRMTLPAKMFQVEPALLYMQDTHDEQDPKNEQDVNNE